MPDENKRIVLTGKVALDKFLAGKEVWNAYVDEYTEADVDFSFVDFTSYESEGFEPDFTGYRFPRTGDISFREAIFGNQDVNFLMFNSVSGTWTSEKPSSVMQIQLSLMHNSTGK